jgi:hypothetical protein
LGPTASQPDDPENLRGALETSTRATRVPVYIHLLIVLAISPASRSDAQADTVYTSLWDHPVHIGAFVGESFPAGTWRNSFEVGDDGALSLALPVTHGSGIWLEGQFNGQSQLMINTIQSAFQATGAGASSPFLGFCGVYGLPAVRTRTQNVFGWDLGGGLRLRMKGFWVVAEARDNAASTRYALTKFVPIVVGIMW